MEKWMHEELARQFGVEYREGMAADRLEAERSGFGWDIEGWSSTDQLLLYIAGSGLHRIPVDEVARLGSALLAEHQLHFTDDISANEILDEHHVVVNVSDFGDEIGDHCDTCGFAITDADHHDTTATVDEVRGWIARFWSQR